MDAVNFLTQIDFYQPPGLASRTTGLPFGLAHISVQGFRG